MIEASEDNDKKGDPDPQPSTEVSKYKVQSSAGVRDVCNIIYHMRDGRPYTKESGYEEYCTCVCIGMESQPPKTKSQTPKESQPFVCPRPFV